MGFFIVFEGGEGNGTTTQRNMLKSALEESGYSVFVSREPGGPEISEIARDLVQNPKYKGKIGSRAEMFLFMVARAQHTEEWILPKLKEYDFYLSDRYRMSSDAYQGHGRGLLKETKVCNEIATQGLVPDLTIVLDISAKLGLEKMTSDEYGEPDRMEQESLKYHIDVNEGFLKEAANDPEKVKIVPYMRNKPEEMHKKILSYALSLIKKK